MKPLSPLLIVVGLFAAAFAQAETPAPTAPAPQSSGWEAALMALAGACKDDRPQLCPGLSEATALACLQKNIDKLTPSCKDAVVKAGKLVL